MVDTHSSQPYITLNNGLKMPQIGLGTFLSSEGDVQEIAKSAIMEYGYRHIDTAAFYKNEEAIGNALTECFAEGIKREEIFITTKLHFEDKDDVESALKLSLKNLKLEYVDLYLIHWPLPKLDLNNAERPFHNTPMHKVWAELERLCEAGLIKSIGVSNVTIAMLIDILAYAKIKPAMNQVEIHPYYIQQDFVNFHKKVNVAITAYSPLGASGFGYKQENIKELNLFKEPVVVEIAAKHSKSPAQIVLNWHLSRGYVIIPKTTKKERLSENLNVFDFKLSEDDVQQISALNCNAKFFNPKIWTHFFNTPLFE